MSIFACATLLVACSDGGSVAPTSAGASAGYVTAYDKPPIEEPDQKTSWLGLLRVTARVPWEDAAR